MLNPALVPPFPETPLTWPGPSTTWLLLLLDLLLEQEQHLLHHGEFLYCTTSRMEKISLFSPFLKEASKEHPGRQEGGTPCLQHPQPGPSQSGPQPQQAGTLQGNTVLMEQWGERGRAHSKTVPGLSCWHFEPPSHPLCSVAKPALVNHYSLGTAGGWRCRGSWAPEHTES